MSSGVRNMRRCKLSAWETETEYYLSIPFDQKDRAKSIRGYRWNDEQKCWCFPRTAKIYKAIIAEFADELISIEITPPTIPLEKENIAILQEENQELKKQLEEKEKLLRTFTELKNQSKTSIESENKGLWLKLASIERQYEENVKELAKRGQDITILQKHLKEAQQEIDRLRSINIAGEFDRNLKEMGKGATGGDRDFCKFVDKLNLDRFAANQIANHLEHTLRNILSINERSFKLSDLIKQAKDVGKLEGEAYHLAHLIRAHRNIVTHGEADPRTEQARILLIFIAAALLWPELPE
jgi:hypothetical protein